MGGGWVGGERDGYLFERWWVYEKKEPLEEEERRGQKCEEFRKRGEFPCRSSPCVALMSIGHGKQTVTGSLITPTSNVPIFFLALASEPLHPPTNISQFCS